jgi:predicted secreted protein
LREKVFAILKNVIPEDTDSKNGRPGMALWKILVIKKGFQQTPKALILQVVIPPGFEPGLPA